MSPGRFFHPGVWKIRVVFNHYTSIYLGFFIVQDQESTSSVAQDEHCRGRNPTWHLNAHILQFT